MNDKVNRGNVGSALNNLSQESPKKYKKDNWEPRFEIDKNRSSISPFNYNGMKNSLYKHDYPAYELKDSVPTAKPELWNSHRNKFPNGKTYCE